MNAPSKQFSGRRVLVTGARGGIGFQIAKDFLCAVLFLAGGESSFIANTIVDSSGEG
jgi:NAD(P)-dependent dehydrogenase (short-subunit alcohol dehydrogenase family)